MSGPARPFFSVLIATHNRRDLLIRSLRSVIGQADDDYEVVLVDDGSTDGSLVAAERFFEANGVRAVAARLPENRGIPVARNACLAAASGEIAAFLDSDDLWHPQYLALLRSSFTATPRPLFAFTDYFSEGPLFSGPVRQFPPSMEAFDPILAIVSHPYIHTMSCFAAPLDDIRAVGGFTERLDRFSDLDLYVRLLAGPSARGAPAWRRRPVVNIPQAAVLKTIHLVDRDLAGYRDAWEAGRTAFLDQVFSYPCLRGRAEHRAECEDALREGQSRLFANFSPGEPASP